MNSILVQLALLGFVWIVRGHTDDPKAGKPGKPNSNKDEKIDLAALPIPVPKKPYPVITDHAYEVRNYWGEVRTASAAEGQFRTEIRAKDGSVKGVSVWLDANKKPHKTYYIADKKGYRVVKENVFKNDIPKEENPPDDSPNFKDDPEESMDQVDTELLERLKVPIEFLMSRKSAANQPDGVVDSGKSTILQSLNVKSSKMLGTRIRTRRPNTAQSFPPGTHIQPSNHHVHMVNQNQQYPVFDPYLAYLMASGLLYPGGNPSSLWIPFGLGRPAGLQPQSIADSPGISQVPASAWGAQPPSGPPHDTPVGSPSVSIARPMSQAVAGPQGEAEAVAEGQAVGGPGASAIALPQSISLAGPGGVAVATTYGTSNAVGVSFGLSTDTRRKTQVQQSLLPAGPQVISIPVEVENNNGTSVVELKAPVFPGVTMFQSGPLFRIQKLGPSFFYAYNFL